MHSFSTLVAFVAAAAWFSRVRAVATLADVCTTAYVTSTLPANDSLPGLSIIGGTITANPVTNYTVQAGNDYPAFTGLDFCNITFAYTHDGLGDQVIWTVC